MQAIETIFLPEARGVLSLTGGGGKTSLMFHLARHLARQGKRVLTTTTTKIFAPTAEQSATVFVDPDPAGILRQAATCATASHITAAAQPIDGGKLQGFAPEVIGIFAESGLFDWILVEADGSARRPLKAPADHEPVIPAVTSILVAVAGLEVMGAPLGEELVFRSALAGPLMGLAPGQTITPATLARLFTHPSGAFKGAPVGVRRLIYLNKADNPERIEAAAEFAQILRQQPHPIAQTLLVGQALEGLRIHAVHLLGNPA